MTCKQLQEKLQQLNPHSNKLRDFKIGCDCKGREIGDHGERITNKTYVL